MRLAELVAASQSVAGTSGRLEKIDRLAALLKRLAPEEIEIAVAFLTGSMRQGRIGVGGALVSAAHDVAPAASPSLELRDVDEAFVRVAAVAGSGSTAARAQTLRDLFARATRDEQEFLVRLIFGELENWFAPPMPLQPTRESRLLELCEAIRADAHCVSPLRGLEKEVGSIYGRDTKTEEIAASKSSAERWWQPRQFPLCPVSPSLPIQAVFGPTLPRILDRS